MKGYGKECVLGPLFKLLEATFELFIPLVVASIVDRGISSGDTGYIVKMCGVMIALGIIGLVCAVTAQYFAAGAAVGFAARLRHAVMERILGLSYTQIDELGTSTMVTRMTSDINQVQNGVNLTLRLLLRSPFVVFGAMIMAFTIDFEAALTFVALAQWTVLKEHHLKATLVICSPKQNRLLVLLSVYIEVFIVLWRKAHIGVCILHWVMQTLTTYICLLFFVN